MVNPSTTRSLVIYELGSFFLNPVPSPAHLEGHWAQPTTFVSNLCKREEAVSRACPHPHEFARTDFFSRHCIYYRGVKHKSADAFSTCLLLSGNLKSLLNNLALSPLRTFGFCWLLHKTVQMSSEVSWIPPTLAASLAVSWLLPMLVCSCKSSKQLLNSWAATAITVLSQT